MSGPNEQTDIFTDELRFSIRRNGLACVEFEVHGRLFTVSAKSVTVQDGADLSSHLDTLQHHGGSGASIAGPVSPLQDLIATAVADDKPPKIQSYSPAWAPDSGDHLSWSGRISRLQELGDKADQEPPSGVVRGITSPPEEN